MLIRRAAIADVPALVGLNRLVQTMHADAYPERFRRDVPDAIMAAAFVAAMEATSAFWLLAVEQEPIGFLSAEFRDREESWCRVARRVCELTGIVVAPDFRRKGVARALVAELTREAELQRARGIELDVWAFNQTAVDAYAKLGFQPLMQRMSLSVERPD
jgi:shikimate dehydrogenase